MRDIVERLRLQLSEDSDNALYIDAIAEIERLRKDSQRLDWLADRDNHIGNVHLPAECVYGHLDDMRAAIDAAMRLHAELADT